MKIYLDTCSLNRPWDDQSQLKVHLEAEAVLFLIEECSVGKLELVSSDYLFAEIIEIENKERREDVSELLRCATTYVACSEAINRRASEFSSFQIRGYDALHLAAAEVAVVDFFITTDERLLKRALRAGNFLKIKLLNPLQWLNPD